VLTSREIAVLIWMLVAGVIALLNKMIRSSLGAMLRAFFQPAIVTIFILMIVYVVGLVLALQAVHLWSPTLLKETTIWLLFVGFPLAFSSFASQESGGEFSSVIIDALKLTVLVEFLVDSYTFPLPVELLFVPLITILLMLRGYASAFQKHFQVESLLGWVQAFIGIVIIVFVVGRVVVDLDNLLTIQTAQELLIAPAMSVLLIPFVYAVLIYLSYESLFIVLKAGQEKDDDLVRYTKWRLVTHLLLSVRGIRDFHRAHGFQLVSIHDKKDVDRIIDGSE